ncbi:Uma2 family endonuclease [Crocosphaera watsonii]|uniref:Uncharacterized protein n=3 Tax=Crocosphaera watsonii TaxID=263511 RepID=T2J9N7_CROWT|nr:Uma2 family endonuclease [Crocosphaera watsonii]CCQ61895.1 hypothetical protein CWATWH0401_2171 [Crocosphaera watsonii WH 0401]
MKGKKEKHEYINGEIYAMGGGRVKNGPIAIRFLTILETHLENSNCITGNSDIKIKIKENLLLTNQQIPR